jgi:hypothetical protein
VILNGDIIFAFVAYLGRSKCRLGSTARVGGPSGRHPAPIRPAAIETMTVLSGNGMMSMSLVCVRHPVHKIDQVGTARDQLCGFRVLRLALGDEACSRAGLSRRAAPTLKRVMVDERLLQWMQRTMRRQALEVGHLGTVVQMRRA